LRTLGVDEHIWRPSHHGRDRAVTAMVDLTRDEQGRLHARLIDVVPGRSGTAYANWLKDQLSEFIAGVEHAALDPFRGYANAIRDELPDAVGVLDAFHVVKLGTQVVDEVRRRVQQETTGHRGLKHDPLYGIRGLLRHGAENLSPRQQAPVSRPGCGSATRTANSSWLGSATSNYARPTAPSYRRGPTCR
jgi:transposase